MPVIKTSVFRNSAVNSPAGLEQAIANVTSQVNAFLASLPNLGDALNIQTLITPVGSSIAYIAVVTYVEA